MWWLFTGYPWQGHIETSPSANLELTISLTWMSLDKEVSHRDNCSLVSPSCLINQDTNNVPWTESWPRASSLPVQGSTDCHKVLCLPCRGRPHWQSLEIHRPSAAPEGSRWRGPAQACFGHRPHGNCSRSWRGEKKGSARVTMRMSRLWKVKKWLVICETS